MHIRERIQELQSAAASVPLPEGWAERNGLIEQADDLQWQLDQYNAIVGAVLAIANRHKAEQERELAELRLKRDTDQPVSFRDFHKLEGMNLDRGIDDPARMLEVSRHADPQARLDDWIRRLQAAALITPGEVRALNTRIGISPAQQAAIKKDADDHQKLIAARDHILSTLTPRDRSDALTQYNLLDEPLSEAKLNTWVSRCVGAKLLGPEWLAGRKLGAKLNELMHGKVKEHGTLR